MKHLVSLFLVLGMSQTLFAQNFDHKHSVWDLLLKKHVKNGLVSYKGFITDSTTLNGYLETLTKVSENQYQSFSDKEKMSFLINAYNAFTVKLIIDHYPIDSITDIGSPISKINLARGIPWKKEFFSLLGKSRHLDWIEHEKLRKDFAEPRIHFAIVCASIGCPNLLSEAYNPSLLEKQLQSAKIGFLKNPKKNSYDKASNTLYLSKIFNWFQPDFTKKTSLIQFIQDGFEDTIKPDAKIIYNEYNWDLNEQK
ncbi:MAG: DUF547 domain-containing protein [Leptospira bouyouniensis]|uniref:DUF547 domain-containing protein n=1 Tax=Leptospira bouyouniensis TaxID=2484911 RepID=A0A7I0HX89_9LEPT|nr:DUF547 domain-containing protein [Leptospira bouyouniensis]TGK49804.1 DUF547 domain-containing protein [Leptospira bouyouniensis]TGL09444.1 DUF547 domain-containing protein [Leptospira bouyouniensis]TGM77993.1 DUF547 domain-containing protein [Leptospira bouyouniensis]